MKLGNYYTRCTSQKKLENNSIKVWLALCKDGNNFYEQGKFKLDLTDKHNMKDPKKAWL